MGVRFTVLICAVAGLYGFLVFHLYDLQVARSGYFVARATSQYLATGNLEASRGSLYFTDKNGSRIPAAIQKDFPVVYAVPKVIEDVTAAAHAISDIFDIPFNDIEKRFEKKSTYELIKKKASDEEAMAAEELNMKGVFSDSALSRYYPMGKLAAHVVGFLGEDAKVKGETGRYGLEKFYQDDIAGVAGQVEEGSISLPKSGRDIVTTIDPNIQSEGERILTNLVKKFKAVSGTFIVEEPKTGKILAMGSVPTFDPNSFSESPIAAYLNPSVQAQYEPGSVFKVLTMAAGIDTGKITPDTTFVDTGKLVLNGKTIQNWDLKAHGKVTMTNVIELSLNTGAAFAERQTGDEAFKAYVQKFGFGVATGVDLPGEVKGDLKSLLAKRAAPIAFAAASFGQGVAVTPLQMINAFSSIANKGKLMRPYITEERKPEAVTNVITARTAKLVTDMMISAVDKAKIAKINGYTIAGKTGTAQAPDLKRGGYSDKVINTYIGFGPTTDPRFVILIRLNEPEGAPLAGLSVVPAFRDLAQFILNYYDIAPDRISEENGSAN